MSYKTALARSDWRSIYRFISWQLTSSIGFAGAIWILYLQYLGFTLAQIGLAESFFHLAPVLLEVPSGSFADLFGRRWSLVLSSVMSVLSAGIFLTGPSFPLVLVAMFLSGASMTFRSGADQAFLFDALNEQQQTRYGRVFGRLLSAGYVLSGISMWLGAWMSHWSYAIPYTGSIIVSLIAIVLAIGLKEPPRERHLHDGGIKTHVRDVRIILRDRPIVAIMMFAAAIYWVALTISELYIQAMLADRGMSNAQIGAFLGFMFLAVAAGTSVGGQLADRQLVWQWPVLVGLTGLGVIVLGVTSMLAVIGVAYVTEQFLSGALETRLSAWYQERLESSKRATVLSIESWMFSCGMIGLFPLAGWFAEREGWAAMYAACGGVMIATGVAALALAREGRTLAS